ncbi:unnamed protein product [Albugo candida]|uniref:Uncharacterized protein n=1 Tax=Albugo candida TaxID=65357 RepID=A0A024FWW7_9STRA|nr:unnamed protein product [Albugo candida]|eukprot:CCI11412.1 unnamed protein product [Albugo candida]
MGYFRAITVLATFVSCHSSPSQYDVQTKPYDFKIQEQNSAKLRDAFRNCQQCLLDFAGIVSLRVTEPSSDKFVVYITASLMAFIRVHTICFEEDVCDKMQLSEGSDSANEITESTWQTPRTIQIEDPYKIVCITHEDKYVREKCRVCLREASDSESIGEFSFFQDGFFQFMYVLRTMRTGDDMAEACAAKYKCLHRVENGNNDGACDAMHNTGVSKHYKSKGITVTNADMNANDKNERKLQCVAAELLEHTSSATIHYYLSMQECMECLAHKTNSPVHRMRISAEHPREMYFLFIMEADPQDSSDCGTCTIKKVETKECYIEYERKFDTLPIYDQISVNMDLTLRRKNVLFHPTSCFIVNYAKRDEDDCMRCIRKIFHSRGSFHGSRMSAISFIVRVDSSEIQRDLPYCITKSHERACMMISYVNNRICLGNEAEYLRPVQE